MKHVWKIRLKPDGTWENVYTDDFYPLDGKGLADITQGKFKDPTREQLEEIRNQYIEEALLMSKWTESEEILNIIMRK